MYSRTSRTLMIVVTADLAVTSRNNSQQTADTGIVVMLATEIVVIHI